MFVSSPFAKCIHCGFTCRIKSSSKSTYVYLLIVSPVVTCTESRDRKNMRNFYRVPTPFSARFVKWRLSYCLLISKSQLPKSSCQKTSRYETLQLRAAISRLNSAVAANRMRDRILSNPPCLLKAIVSQFLKFELSEAQLAGKLQPS